MLVLIGSASPEASLLDLGAGRACFLLCAHRVVPPRASGPAVSLCIPVPPYKDTSQIGLGVTLTAHLFKPLPLLWCRRAQPEWTLSSSQASAPSLSWGAG